jgi:hypothetical protein
MLELEHVRRFLADAGPEPLFWEAKGTELSRSEVRLQACGFANSHDGGFLILGVSETNVVWTLDGLAFPSDPTTWISEVVGNGGVNPYPDGLTRERFASRATGGSRSSRSRPFRRRPATPADGCTSGYLAERSRSGSR